MACLLPDTFLSQSGYYYANEIRWKPKKKFEVKLSGNYVLAMIQCNRDWYASYKATESGRRIVFEHEEFTPDLFILWHDPEHKLLKEDIAPVRRDKSFFLK